MDEAALAAVFRKLGARDPESWARSQVEEGIPQLARFLFLRQAWRSVVAEDDVTWVDRTIASATARPDDPYSGAGRALAKLRERGATDHEILPLVRAAQAELLFAFCYLLEDPGDVEPEVDGVSWALFRIDDDGNPLEPIGGLHESVLETDPTGREMRPGTNDAA